MEMINVICVDDDIEVLRSISDDLLYLSNYVCVEECESAKEVLTLLEQLDDRGEHVAVIITDQIMPQMTGVELLEVISKDRRFIKTKKILLTGQASHKDTIQAINESGIDKYIEKPWKSEELMKVVKALLTEYVFDASLNYLEIFDALDSNIVMQRLHNYIADHDGLYSFNAIRFR